MEAIFPSDISKRRNLKKKSPNIVDIFVTSNKLLIYCINRLTLHYIVDMSMIYQRKIINVYG